MTIAELKQLLNKYDNLLPVEVLLPKGEDIIIYDIGDIEIREDEMYLEIWLKEAGE